jgi:hypothetical protein
MTLTHYDSLIEAAKIIDRECSVDYNNDHRRQLAHLYFLDVLQAAYNERELPPIPRLLTIPPQ